MVWWCGGVAVWWCGGVVLWLEFEKVSTITGTVGVGVVVFVTVVSAFGPSDLFAC